MVLVDVVKSVSCCAETLSLLQSFYVFLSGSAVHKLWVLLQTENGVSVIELKSISDTRWACQANMISAFCSRLEIFLNLLQRIIDNDSESARVVAARGYLGQVDRTFVRYLFALKYILMSAKSVSDFLQRPGNSLADAISVIESFELTLQEARSNDKCQVFWDAADSACESADIPERVLRRPRKLNSRLAGTLVDAPVEADNTNSFQTFKRNIFAVIDKMLCEMNRRFSECNKKTMKGIDALTPNSGNYLNDQTITEFACEYSSLLTVDYLEAEVANFRQLLKRKMESNSADSYCPASLLQLHSYVHNLCDAFSEFDKLVTIACTLPISTASCERSFSTLRIIKSYLRTTMANDRLHDLMLLGIHRARASKLNFDDVVLRFARKYPNSKIQLV